METNQVPTAAQVNALVSKWSARHPDLSERLERAAALLDNVKALDAGRNYFAVEGSYDHRYIVRVDRQARTSTCSCPDYQKRGLRCKHILSAAILEAERTWR